MYLLIVTGLSGAGKSNVLRYLEDMGFYCVDNLPGELISRFTALCSKANPPVEKAALVIDSRESIFRSDSELLFNTLEGMDVEYEILFMDCRNDVLELRYSETRRVHPMCPDVKEGIQLERELLQLFRERANYIIDTSNLTPLECNIKLQNTLGSRAKKPFALVIESFGYKRGIPIESDIVIDMRFTKNPFYEEALRNLSGLDDEVKVFVMSDEVFRRTLENIKNMLEELIPRFALQGKHRLMIAFGCTGGRHRSVCAADTLYTVFKDKYPCTIIHRDLVLEAHDIDKRFN